MLSILPCTCNCVVTVLIRQNGMSCMQTICNSLVRHSHNYYGISKSLFIYLLVFFHFRAFTGFNFQTQKFALFILLVLICNVLLHITYYAAAKAVFRETKCWPPSKVFVFTVLTLLCWAAGLLVFTLVSA